MCINQSITALSPLQEVANAHTHSLQDYYTCTFCINNMFRVAFVYIATYFLLKVLMPSFPWMPLGLFPSTSSYTYPLYKSVVLHLL